MFEFTQYVLRHPGYALKNWRNLSVVRKAMAQYRAEHPHCAWCGRDKKLDVHHIIPVSVAPFLAADMDNMLMLCRKPACHLIIGHDGDYGGRYVLNVRDITSRGKVALVKK